MTVCPRCANKRSYLNCEHVFCYLLSNWFILDITSLFFYFRNLKIILTMRSISRPQQKILPLFSPRQKSSRSQYQLFHCRLRHSSSLLWVRPCVLTSCFHESFLRSENGNFAANCKIIGPPVRFACLFLFLLLPGEAKWQAHCVLAKAESFPFGLWVWYKNKPVSVY